MTDEQIIRALECCASESSDKACNGCPFNEAKMCDKDRFALEKYTLSLINRQKAEIEKLKADSEMADGYADALERYAREKAIKESLVMMDDMAFIVNVKNNTVITAIDQNDTENQVFTNIDGAVIV